MNDEKNKLQIDCCKLLAKLVENHNKENQTQNTILSLASHEQKQ